MIDDISTFEGSAEPIRSRKVRARIGSAKQENRKLLMCLTDETSIACFERAVKAFVFFVANKTFFLFAFFFLFSFFVESKKRKFLFLLFFDGKKYNNTHY